VQVRTMVDGDPGARATIEAVSYYGDFSDLVIRIGETTKLRCRYAGHEQFHRGASVIATVTGDFSCLSVDDQRSERR